MNGLKIEAHTVVEGIYTVLCIHLHARPFASAPYFLKFDKTVYLITRSVEHLAQDYHY